MDKLNLLGFEVENVLRIKSLTVTMPEDGALVIGGENEHGKTSALRALELAFAGGEAQTAEDPIHGDEDQAKVIARFDGYTVEKQWRRTRKGISSKLVIKDADGKVQSSPQTMWARFLSFYSLDPVKFLRLEESEQARIITKLSGVDLAPFVAKRKEAFDARTDANREVKRLEGALASTPYDPKAPTEETSVKQLTDELRKRREHNTEGDALDQEYRTAMQSVTEATSAVQRTNDRITALQLELDALLNTREQQQEAVTAATDKKAEAFKALTAFTPADEDEVVSQISTIEETNKRCRANAEHNRIAIELDEAKAVAGARQADLDAVDAAEAEARAAAEGKIPVEGLSVSGDHVLYKGKPFSQAGDSAKLRVSAGIAMALNTDRPVKLLLIDEVETLSPKHQREVVKDATARGFAVIMTMVSGRGPSHVEIVDGIGRTE